MQDVYLNLTIPNDLPTLSESFSGSVLRIENTYDWITATADSRISSRICVMTSRLIITNLIDGPVFPSRVKSKCPAIMLAVSRIARVPGRMMFLIVSIHTMHGISTGGVP
ncbi:hypothetical protein ILUMI_08823 [Ignelater luminosus]|uniref:Uncharacterized protein n=1 Tax=Ignelater luminosus TaxID=2038154 RepID=A0A8K0D5I6_IGNLU|nr:hypothetical protein ILUMI_08823 [Ignelater luminosus]